VTLDEIYWKWALIAVRSGVEGFMVLALEHGNALLPKKNDIAARWLKAHDAVTRTRKKDGLLPQPL
jgi:hypothetical protein